MCKCNQKEKAIKELHNIPFTHGILKSQCRQYDLDCIVYTVCSYYC